MNLKCLMFSSLISIFLLGTAGCSEPIPQQNKTQSEASQLYEQGGRYFLGKDVTKDYQKPFLISKWQRKRDYLSLKMI